MTGATPVRVDVWSDVQCIWCYISSARLRSAIEQFDGVVEVVHHSFELTPDAPVEIDRDAHIRSHGTDPVRMQQIMDQLTRLTGEEGLAYHPALTRPTNSHLALELLHQAGVEGRRPDLTNRLFTAYFAEGRHIGHIDELLLLAEEAGLDGGSARIALEDRRHASAVDADIARARSLGAQGVPFSVIDGTWGLSGAQPAAGFVAALEHARDA